VVGLMGRERGREGGEEDTVLGGGVLGCGG